MKLIELIPAMEEKLNIMDEFSTEMVNHLSYTRNFYLLEKDEKKVITNKKTTLIALQNYMTLTGYEAFILREDEALEALKVLEVNKVKNKTKKEPTPEPKKETVSKKNTATKNKKKKVEPKKKKSDK